MSDLAGLEAAIPALRRYAWALLRDGAEADDLVQDCLVRALDRMDTRRAEADLRPWLFSIMHNLCVSRWRRARVRLRALREARPEEAVPAAQPASAELRDVLRGLDALPDEQRQVILLVAVEGLSYAEVAGVVGVPVGTVMSRLSRARDRLRDLTEGRRQPVLRRVK
jgi:RNA polymerase sigma-70 factor, ECF subfamily